MQRKKSRFWLFIFSFMPGAGEMYMGFMKMGLSLMLGFMILVAVVGYTNLGVLAVFPVAMYIYSFFHANNLGSLDDVAFHNIEDQYLFGFDGIDKMKIKLEGRNRKIAAVILIVLGVIMLWQVVFNLLCDIFGWDNRFLSAIYYFVRDDLPRAIVGIGVIWAGLALIRGKRVEIEEQDPNDDRQYGHGEQSFYRRSDQADGRPIYRDSCQERTERPGMQGQPVYREQPTDGGQPVNEGQPVADGRIIYAQGPVAGDGTANESTGQNGGI